MIYIMFLEQIVFVLFLDEFVDKLFDLAQFSPALGVHHLLLIIIKG